MCERLEEAESPVSVLSAGYRLGGREAGFTLALVSVVLGHVVSSTYVGSCGFGHGRL